MNNEDYQYYSEMPWKILYPFELTVPKADMIFPVVFEYEHWVNVSEYGQMGKYSTRLPEKQKAWWVQR